MFSSSLWMLQVSSSTALHPIWAVPYWNTAQAHQPLSTLTLNPIFVEPCFFSLFSGPRISHQCVHLKKGSRLSIGQTERVRKHKHKTGGREQRVGRAGTAVAAGSLCSTDLPRAPEQITTTYYSHRTPRGKPHIGFFYMYIRIFTTGRERGTSQDHRTDDKTKRRRAIR